MRFRPRYSLLTLLVLTALVAGAVKLWYGPHHVVQRTAEDEEAEYTYTHDWRGGRIIQGPIINRKYFAGQLGRVEVKYFRQGKLLDWHYYCLSNLDADFIEPFPSTAFDSPLTSEEQVEFRATVERVKIKREPSQAIFVEESYFPELPLLPKDETHHHK